MKYMELKGKIIEDESLIPEEIPVLAENGPKRESEIEISGR